MKEQSLVRRWAMRIELWPRLVRIVLTLLVSVFLVLLVWLLLAGLVGGGITSAEPKPVLTVIVLLLGVLVYVPCWAALVGFDTQGSRTWHAGPSAVYFLLAGALSLLLIILIVAVIVM